MIGFRSVFLFVACALAFAAPAHAVRELRGQTPGGAQYLIVAPDAWRAGDALILYNHGFNLNLDTNPDVGPLRDIALAQGYAIAASGFRQRGWALFTATNDNVELVERVTRDLGAPGAIIPFGGSMGGLIALKTAEDARLAARVPGVFAVCPPAAGAHTWDQAFDLRLAYDAVCGDVPDADLPRGTAPHTWAFDLEDIPTGASDLTDAAAILPPLAGISRCTGLGFNQIYRSAAQRERLARLMAFAHTTDEEAFVTLMAYSTFALGDLVRAADKLAGRNPFQNNTRNVAYRDSEIQRDIPRVSESDPFAALDFHRASSLYGTGQAKILSLHTSGDEIVVPEHQDVLRTLYPADRLAHALVQETVPTHCGFKAAELLAGWEGLRRWIANGPKPTPASLQTECTAITALGVGGPCRIVPVPPSGSFSLDNKIARREFKPRNGISGSWLDPSRAGEGWTVELQPAVPGVPYDPNLGPSAVSWFTYPPPGESGNQRWIVGAGRVEANALVVDPAVAGVSGQFPRPGFPSAGVTQTWGVIEFEFGVDGFGWVRYGGRVPYVDEVRRIQQLSLLGHCPECREASPPANGRWARSGSYFDPAAPGSGIVLQIQTGERFADPIRPLLVWYT
ncbi:MAG: alpha/beta hydrolase, partial [Ilumatobacteraceae bacterium]